MKSAVARVARVAQQGDLRNTAEQPCLYHAGYSLFPVTKHPGEDDCLHIVGYRKWCPRCKWVDA